MLKSGLREEAAESTGRHEQFHVISIDRDGSSLSFPGMCDGDTARIISSMSGTSPPDGPDAPTPTDPDSALPSVLARVLAFASILVGGVAGGFIGYAFADLGGISGSLIGLVTFLGAVIGAGGVAVVAVLTLRALGEWQTIRGDAGRPRR